MAKSVSAITTAARTTVEWKRKDGKIISGAVDRPALARCAPQ